MTVFTQLQHLGPKVEKIYGDVINWEHTAKYYNHLIQFHTQTHDSMLALHAVRALFNAAQHSFDAYQQYFTCYNSTFARNWNLDQLTLEFYHDYIERKGENLEEEICFIEKWLNKIKKR